MENRYPLPEPPGEALHRLWGKRDFRHQHNGAAPLLNDRLNALEEHLCFPASGHAVKQKRLALPAIRRLRDAADGRRLLPRRRERLRARNFGKIHRFAKHFHFLRPEDSLLHQRLDCPLPRSSEQADIAVRYKIVLQQQLYDLCLSRRFVPH